MLKEYLAKCLKENLELNTLIKKKIVIRKVYMQIKNRLIRKDARGEEKVVHRLFECRIETQIQLKVSCQRMINAVELIGSWKIIAMSNLQR